ncbi:MFS transporter [Rhizoctonia solani AG-1 IA]|uniref:MFS transporter n=1 Tax=Thanatephorus cucumeris (strain AG1-IA) TaxID=983506 RepID=L8X4E5_THACA|nr:MFS transporter [Rhizoctonia solani AG-1 IA]
MADYSISTRPQSIFPTSRGCTRPETQDHNRQTFQPEVSGSSFFAQCSAATMSLSTEDVGKGQPSHIESSPNSVIDTPTYHADVDTSQIDEKKLLRKVDMRLIPWLSLLYLLSFLDRTSIGNAKLYSLEEDLGLTDKQYLIALTIFFFSYSIFEATNCHHGQTVQGLVHNYGGLLGMRWMLGTFEAGLFPGVNYYLSWYVNRSRASRFDVYRLGPLAGTNFGIRAALFFSAATVSGAFGGLLAAAISKMDGIGGKPGLATVLAGAASFWIIQDFPDEAKFLTEEERAFIVRRLQSDDQFSAAGEKLRAKFVVLPLNGLGSILTYMCRYIFQALKDWKTWLGMLCYAGTGIPPLVLTSIDGADVSGYTATPANLLSVPVYAWACILTVGVGYMADRIGNRGVFNFQYYCLDEQQRRRIVQAERSSWDDYQLYRARDKPWYSLGHGIVLMYIVIGWITSLAFIILLRRENAKRERGERDEVITGDIHNDEKAVESRNGVYSTVEEAKRDKGDDWSGYQGDKTKAELNPVGGGDKLITLSMRDFPESPDQALNRWIPFAKK